MVALWILIAACFLLGAGAAVAVAREVAHDGYGARPGPRSHPRDEFDPGSGRVVIDPPSRAVLLRGGRLIVGLALYGFSLALMVRAAVGLGPWDVLAQGVARASGLPFGVVTNLIGALVVVLWWPLRQRPGVGTVANVLLVGTSAQVGLAVLGPVEALPLRIALFAAGMLLLAFATAVYIGPGLGAGPRDGLMLGIRRRFGLPIWLARTLVEGSALVLGWLLGGQVGVGTLVFALGIGPLCDLAIRLVPATPLTRH